MRTDTAEDLVKISEILAEKYPLMLSGGNMYALPYASDVMDFPLSNSGLLLEKQSVPFASIVLHGYVNYAPQTLNNTSDKAYALLKVVEMGASLRFA